MRMLEKNSPPDQAAIDAFLGAKHVALLQRLETMLGSRYALARELRFPFGNQYGWGYKYSHRQAHLCYVFFEEGAFTVMLQLGDACVPSVERLLPELSQKARTLWETRYPCGKNGGWIQYVVEEPAELSEVLALIALKKKPIKQ